jgi:purine-binding chemotaxis protein CheW
MPDWVRGVINLRGKIIPVIDLRIRFGLQPSSDTQHSCTIVVQARLPEGKTTQLGMIVDGVEEVIQIATGDIEASPDFGRDTAGSYIVGMAKVRGTVKTLLDVDRVMAGDLPSELV